jgi:hypothetical protein
METLQPYLSYLGIGAALVGAIALLLWIGGVIRIRVKQCHETLKVLYGNIFSHQAFFSKGD